MRKFLRAVEKGKEARVARMVEADPTLLHRDRYEDHSPLAVAARHARSRVVQVLLQHMKGEGLDDWDESGNTALHYAAAQGLQHMAADLLKHGAQPMSTDQSGYLPLMCASASGHLPVVRMLVQHMGGRGLDERQGEGYDSYNHEGSTALHCAAYWGQAEVVRFLLFAGADPNVEDNEGNTPYIWVEEAQQKNLGQKPNQEDRDLTNGRARCMEVLQWWEGELERRHVLYRAICLHKAFTTQRDMPTSQVPTYLEARVAAGHAVPSVEVVSPQSEGQRQEQQASATGKSKAGERHEAQEAGAGGEEVQAVLTYVVTSLNEELLTELLEGFHAPIVRTEEEEEDVYDDDEYSD